MRWLLDTDACIWCLRGREPLISRVAAVSPDDIGVSSMTEAELRYGSSRARDADLAAKVVDRFLAPITVLPFDSPAARVHATIRFVIRSAPIGERDLVIASVAVANDLVLVSSNVREFARIPGLAIEDWLRPE